MEAKFWVFIHDDGESEQWFGTFQEAMDKYLDNNGFDFDSLVAVVSHQ